MDAIAAHNPARAATFVDELAEKCENLVANPNMYSLTPGYERAGIRRIVQGNYQIFFIMYLRTPLPSSTSSMAPWTMANCCFPKTHVPPPRCANWRLPRP
ncbi:MAG: type II toxin-antitoxin system RelE/ParE family toxin [Beijerinckiaceae bacterium]